MASVLLRTENIIVQQVIELADSLDVFCLQVFNGLAGCTYCFSFPSSLNFFAEEEVKF